MTDILWLFAVAIGPMLLAVAMVYALFQCNRLTADEALTHHEAP